MTVNGTEKSALAECYVCGKIVVGAARCTIREYVEDGEPVLRDACSGCAYRLRVEGIVKIQKGDEVVIVGPVPPGDDKSQRPSGP